MSNNIEAPESLKPLTDHMVQYDPEKHSQVGRALVFFDAEVVSRAYIGGHSEGGIFVWDPESQNLTPALRGGGNWSFGRSTARRYANHILIFEIEDTEAEKRKKIEALEAMPAGSMGTYVGRTGTQYMVFKDEKGRWGNLDIGVIAADNLHKISNTDDGSILLPNEIRDKDELRMVLSHSENALKRATIKDCDGDRIKWYEGEGWRRRIGGSNTRPFENLGGLDYFPWTIEA